MTRPYPKRAIDSAAFTDALSRGVELLVAGRDEAAAAVFQELGHDYPVPGKRYVPPRLQVRVFRRDRFICRYCERRTVFLPALLLLSLRYPDVFRAHSNWKLSETHLAFWRDTASCDHLVPVARGGCSCPENLVTSCYMCNSVKGNWLLDELGWGIAEPATGDWDGLTSSYGPLLRLAEQHPDRGLSDSQRRYHAAWLAELERAERDRARGELLTTRADAACRHT